MRRLGMLVGSLVAALLLLTAPLGASGGHGGGHGSGQRSGSRAASGRAHAGSSRGARAPRPPRTARAPRSSGMATHGHVHRSEAARDQFMRQTGYPHGRKDYVVDHITPLACGGADAPSNMQWQTKQAAKAMTLPPLPDGWELERGRF